MFVFPLSVRLCTVATAPHSCTRVKKMSAVYGAVAVPMGAVLLLASR